MNQEEAENQVSSCIGGGSSSLVQETSKDEIFEDESMANERVGVEQDIEPP
jgi:hypothetical protein